jgi:putative Mg2+ transporter-C (MgtC) family protein
MDAGLKEALELLLALGLGAAVGFERMLRGHTAGIHTHALVALGSCAFVIAGLTLPGNNLAVVPTSVVTGSGFICAGVILHRGINIQGLNTAATLWCVSALGVLCAVSRPLLACMVASAALLANVVFHFVEHTLLVRPVDKSI